MNESAERIAAHIRSQIYRGELKPGTLVPSENQLAREFGVSRSMSRKALQKVELEGLLQRRQGAGTTVRQFENRRFPGMQNGKKTVAVIINQFNYRHGKVIASALMDRLHERDVQSILFKIDFEDENEYRFVHEIHLSGFDGLAFWPQHSGDLLKQMLGMLIRRRFPVVLYDLYFKDVDCDTVSSHNEDIGRQLGQALIEDGARHIAFVTESLYSNAISVLARIRGLRKSIRRNRALGIKESILELPLTTRDTTSMDPVYRSLARMDRPDAFLVTHSGLVLRMRETLESLGYQIGRDVLLAFVDDDKLQDRLDVPCISIEQNSEQIGIATADLLLSRIDNHDRKVRHKFVPAQNLTRHG